MQRDHQQEARAGCGGSRRLIGRATLSARRSSPWRFDAGALRPSRPRVPCARASALARGGGVRQPAAPPRCRRARPACAGRAAPGSRTPRPGAAAGMRRRLRRVRAEDREQRLREQAVADGDRAVAGARQHVHPLAVGVAVAALARQARAAASAPPRRPCPWPGSSGPTRGRSTSACEHLVLAAGRQRAPARTAAGVRSVRRASAGAVGRRSSRQPAQLGLGDEPARAWRRNGRLTSIVSPDSAHARAAGRARSGATAASASFSAHERRAAPRASVRGSSVDRQLEVARLARERAGGGVEVGDQRLQRLGAAVEPARHPPARVDVARTGRAGARRASRPARSPSCGRRAPSTGSSAGSRRRPRPRARCEYSCEQRLEVLARVRLERGEQLPELHRAARLLRSGSCRRRAARRSPACRARGRGTSCPRGTAAARILTRARRGGPAGPRPRSASGSRRAPLPGSGCSTSTTLPTSTPAIRTGWRSFTLLAVRNTALDLVVVAERQPAREGEVRADGDHARARSGRPGTGDMPAAPHRCDLGPGLGARA